MDLPYPEKLSSDEERLYLIRTLFIKYRIDEEGHSGLNEVVDLSTKMVMPSAGMYSPWRTTIE
jgi:hypothetical protein